MKDNFIFLMRHGRTRWNLEGRLQGRQNSPLLDSGKSTARIIAKYLAKQHLIERVYSSPLPRCVETAQIVCDVLGIGFELRRELMECDMGRCEGSTWQAAKEQFPTFMAQRESYKWTTAWPNGESYEDVYARSEAFLQVLPEGENILIIGHEMLNKCIIGACLNWEPSQIIAFRQPNHELSIIQLKSKRIETICFETSSESNATL